MLVVLILSRYLGKVNHSRMALCLLPVRFTHSTVRCTARTSRHRSLIHFVHLTSISTARVSVSCLNTHTFPNPQQQHFRLFLPVILFATQKSVTNHCRFNQPVLIVLSCYWNENNCPRTCRHQLFPISTAQHHHAQNLTFRFLKK